MKTGELINLRLANQQIAETTFKNTEEIVGWLGAMQAQEYAMAKWAIGLRLPHLREHNVEKAFTDGRILRTHLLRPTWHFVTPEDIRWMLTLTAPRVHAFNSPYYKKSELDSALLIRSADVIAKLLKDGKQLTRAEIKATLEHAKIAVDGLRFTLILMYAELEGLICSGARTGKQFTYTLLEERVPATKGLSREESLAKLVTLYFRSRGPATLHDFVWWSGLTMKDARDGTELLEDRLSFEVISGNKYFFIPATVPIIKRSTQRTFLMPDYDEYGISYKDRSILFKDKGQSLQSSSENLLSNHTIIINGVAGGTWKRIEKKHSFTAEVSPFTELNATNQQQLAKAIKRYSAFFNSISGET